MLRSISRGLAASGGAASKLPHGFFSRVLQVIAGNALYALAVRLFLVPAGLVTSGTTGIALALQKIVGIPMSGSILIMNTILLLLGLIFLGRAFALTTLVSTFVYPLALRVFEALPLPAEGLTQDLLLNTIFSGLLFGVAFGIVFRAGSSTGGMDIPPLILQKHLGFPLTIGIYLFDIGIIVLQAVVYPLERVLYGIVVMVLYTIVLDRILIVGTSRTEVRIISPRADEIRQAILTELDRGVTMLEARTGYLEKDTEIVMSVISNRELPKVERLVRTLDPECLLIINRVSEVRGRGFTLSKQYR